MALTFPLPQLDDINHIGAATGIGSTDSFNLWGYMNELNTRMNIVEGGGATGLTFNVKDYGALGDGVTSDLTAINAAITAAAVDGGEVFFPPGVYMVPRTVGQFFSVNLNADNIRLRGVKGASWLKHPNNVYGAGAVGDPINILRVQACTNIVIADMGFDGNWGNSVGGTDSQAGLNQGTQGDPKSHALMIRGSTGVTVINCLFRQTYGDAIWIGASATDFDAGSNGVSVINCEADMSARNGLTLGQKCDNTLVYGWRATNIFSGAIDSEPVDQYVRNVQIRDCSLGGWWNPGNVDRSGNAVLHIVGGKFFCPAPTVLARNWLVSGCHLYGSCIIESAQDITIENCRIVTDWDLDGSPGTPGKSYAPILLAFHCDNIWIRGNYIYDRTEGEVLGNRHEASIFVKWDGGSLGGDPGGTSHVFQPANVHIEGNQIHTRAGLDGIKIEGAGGGVTSLSLGQGAISTGDSGTAEAIAATTLTDNDKVWTVNQWTGWKVFVGAAQATILSNTDTVLTLFVEASDTSGWTTANGEDIATPAAGAYSIRPLTGIVTIADNHIDLSDDGNGQGRYGIWLQAARAGMRCVVMDNDIKNADTDAIHVTSTDAARQYRYLKIAGNTGWDDQATPTCTNTVNVEATYQIHKADIRDNVAGEGVTNALVGYP